jgi:hypothetical protein
MQYEFSPSLKVLKIWKVPTLFKSISSSLLWDSRQAPTLSPYKIKNKWHSSNIQRHTANNHTWKGELGKL